MKDDVLDPVDHALVQGLTKYANLYDDEVFPVIIEYLLASIKAGGLRIPLAPDRMAEGLEYFLRDLSPASDKDSHSPVPKKSKPAKELAQEFDDRRNAGKYDAVIGKVVDPDNPPFYPLLVSGQGLYFQKHHAAEASVSAKLARLLSAPDSGMGPDSLRNLLDTVLVRFPLHLSTDPNAPVMEFDIRQKQALDLAARKRLTVISGGPGTGKTAIAANLLRVWTRAWLAKPRSSSGETIPLGGFPRIRLAAPTGRAAQRLAESLHRSLGSVHHEKDTAAIDPPFEKAVDDFISTLPCETLHSLLRYNPDTGEFSHQKSRPLPADLILVDEVSMVDIFVLSRLLESMEPHACLVLLGDMDQLPSVDSGAVLADLVPDPASGLHPLRDNLVLLEKSHRSEASILTVARCINVLDGEGALKAMSAEPTNVYKWPVGFIRNGQRSFPDGGCRLLLPHSTEAKIPNFRSGLDAYLKSWTDFHYLNHSFNPKLFPNQQLANPHLVSYADCIAQLGAFPTPEDVASEILDQAFAYLDQARILTFTRIGWHGSIAINRRIGECLARKLDPQATPGSEIFHGAPILIQENQHAKGLSNGDVGIMLRLRGRTMAFFRRGDGYQTFPAAFLPRHETAFAMTIHKSQGSEYDQVLLILPEAGNRLLFKETLYTGLTRARYFAGIYGSREIFLEAVARKVVRESGLPDYLNALGQS